MDKLVLTGGQRLRGDLYVGGSKNTALPLMAAALLAPGKTTLHNMPVLKDVHTFANVLRVSGAGVVYKPDDDPNTPDSMEVDATRITHPEAPYELVSKMRASFYMLGALLGRCGEARVSLPGGCAWGPRPVDLHMKGMEALGAKLDLDMGYVVAKAPGGRLTGGDFRFDPVSVGATINVMLAAVTAEGTSTLSNVAQEPDVVVFGEMLQAMGAKIDGLGTDTLVITGVDEMQPVEFSNCPDRIEAGTYMIAAAMAAEPGDTVTLHHVNPEHLGPVFLKAFEDTGTPFEIDGDTVRVTAPDAIQPVSVETAPYPGFATDLQAQWTVFMTQADGSSEVVDTIYADRFKHIPELSRMGAKCIVHGNKVVIEGMPKGEKLQGATVMSTDLRASVSLVMAGMVAEGETHVLRVYHLDRGYENLEGKLQGAGIEIHRADDEEVPEAAEA